MYSVSDIRYASTWQGYYGPMGAANRFRGKTPGQQAPYAFHKPGDPHVPRQDDSSHSAMAP